MHVAQPLPTMNAEEQHQEQKRMLQRTTRYLSTTAEQIRDGFVAHPIADLKLPVTWSVATDTDAAEAIIRGAENGGDAARAGVFGGCDVIAMATMGAEGLERWAMGSITERVLHAVLPTGCVYDFPTSSEGRFPYIVDCEKKRQYTPLEIEPLSDSKRRSLLWKQYTMPPEPISDD